MNAPRVSGDCWIHFAFDAAAAIDLERAESVLPSSMPTPGATTTREAISDVRRAPSGIQFRPKPLRIIRPMKPLAIDGASCLSEPEVELTLYDFGAISVAYRLRFSDATLESLRHLSTRITAAAPLAAAAREQVRRIVGDLGGAARRSAVADAVEDYLVFHIDRWNGSAGDALPIDPVRDGAEIAAILRGAEEPLSRGEIDDALACVIAYGQRDVAIIDWNAAIIVEPDRASSADLLAVLEYANVELVELRFLDDRLDGVLERVYHDLWMAEGPSVHEGRGKSGAAVSARGWRGAFAGWSREARRERRRLAALHMDSALLFEGINNAIKLLGDQYLARVYRLAARRFHLADWDAAILRKIETLQRLYEKTADEQATRRMEVLEWIIIILIAVSILVMFIPGAK